MVAKKTTKKPIKPVFMKGRPNGKLQFVDNEVLFLAGWLATLKGGYGLGVTTGGWTVSTLSATATTFLRAVVVKI